MLNSRLERELLLAYVLDVSRTFLYAASERTISLQQEAQFMQLIARRQQGEPMAYLMGVKEFWSLPLQISKAVLIPRPETELLVELALALIPEKNSSVRVLDLGTGSGAIALALAAERKNWEIMAVDQSEAALQIAVQNAKKLAITNVSFHKSDWFAELPAIGHSKSQAFTIIISNPPYIELNDPHLTQTDIQYEPKEALISGPDGLEDIRQIIAVAPEYLAPKGWLMLEHGFTQSESVKHLMKMQGLVEIQAFTDLSGLPRVVIGRMP